MVKRNIPVKLPCPVSLNGGNGLLGDQELGVREENCLSTLYSLSLCRRGVNKAIQVYLNSFIMDLFDN